MQRMAAEPRKKRENCCEPLENVHRRRNDERPLMWPRGVSSSLPHSFVVLIFFIFFLVKKQKVVG